MSDNTKPKIYRDMIDELVRMCNKGQGNIGASRVRKGVWHQSASPDFLEDQHRINLILNKLSNEEREVLANMLSQEVILGVFETLKVLEKNQITPFEEGYEGSPYNDFIGRVDNNNPWQWPLENH